MPYAETKVYFDGSHYIAIPHTTRSTRRSRASPEETIVVVDKTNKEISNSPTVKPTKNSYDVNNLNEEVADKSLIPSSTALPKVRKMTKKDLFEELYKNSMGMRRKTRKQYIIDGIKEYFPNIESAEEYVTKNLERKLRNLICRRIRMYRKANLQNFNYFCTFTYDSEKHTEQSFQKGLKTTFRNLCYRNGWKYMGVWERSPEKKRLHFHGIFYIPEGTLPGRLLEFNDYSFATHKRQITMQSVYFIEKFGRNDFVPIDIPEDKTTFLRYIIKYLEKSGERIVYSKGLPQFFISDIMDEDVAAPFGQEDKKLLLFDDFTCWDEGCYMGKVSPKVIAQMRKVN